MRLGDLTLAERLARLERVWGTVEANPAGKFIVITPTKVRIRDLPG